MKSFRPAYAKVSTHSRLKAAGNIFVVLYPYCMVSTHSRLKAAGARKSLLPNNYTVSTHSRLKAAGSLRRFRRQRCRCFNTQPPEGGWQAAGEKEGEAKCFNTQPPEGGWYDPQYEWGYELVSTHSRLKAAGCGGIG